MKKNKILKIVSSIVFLTAVVVLANTYSKRNEEIPVEQHDVTMDAVAVDRGIIFCRMEGEA